LLFGLTRNLNLSGGRTDIGLFEVQVVADQLPVQHQHLRPRLRVQLPLYLHLQSACYRPWLDHRDGHDERTDYRLFELRDAVALVSPDYVSVRIGDLAV
jgi:hypothetical protein